MYTIKNFEDFLTTVFVIIDDLCQTVLPRWFKSRKGKKPIFRDSEVITFALAQDCSTFVSENRFYGFFRKNFLSLFSRLVDRSQLNRRVKGLRYVIEWIRNQLLRMMGLDGSEHRVVDSCPVPIVHFKRAHYTPLFKGEAAYGYCASKDERYYGLRLNLMTTFNGIPTDF